MLFHSLEYGIFLILTFVGFWALSRRRLLRVVFLLLASWVFYAASNPWFLTLILASTITDYISGRVMGHKDEGTPERTRRLCLIVSLVVNLGLLGVFKYTNFFYESAVDVANLAGLDWVYHRVNILLPAGISFYTFQTMSYSIDVYRGRLAPERSLLRFALFVGFFPQLVAGPIVRAVDFIPQITRRAYLTRAQASRAAWLIGVGLFKKVVIADFLAVNLVDRVFMAPERFSSLEVLVGLYGYTMQVYMDFSAYSDIAIGSALLFGFHLPDNFDRPYMATSIQDFWRRWHKTLGSWLRDYLYYPLGGSRGSDARTYFNLLVTFLLIGLWHGADWTFVVYGCCHAAAMCTHRFFRVNVNARAQATLNAWGWVWRVIVTLHFIVFTRILFRCQDFGHVGDVLASLGQGSFHLGHLTSGLLWLLLGTYVVHWTPRRWVNGLRDRLEALPAFVQGPLFALALLVIMQASSSEVVPFIYFQF